jgi:hypothetical protein
MKLLQWFSWFRSAKSLTLENVPLNENKRILKERQRHPLKFPLHVRPGDKIVCTCKDKTGRVERVEENINREMIVDTVVTFDIITPTLGLSEGVGAIFGKATTE